MSNLKRAFSMVMALVMVLGMITIPAATATDAAVSESIFSDANEITYGEAVAITGGIGLFAGTDGKFLPKGTVTRAQMATIIVKMLYGADANADSFKGSGKFVDTAFFEGGWAEGYVNWCATLGIVAGYGDGTFKPGNEVTTAEAATMILNALKIDAGEGTWPTTVMAKATEEGMFKDLKKMPGTNVALNREQLAVVALNGLNWTSSDETGWYVTGGTADENMTFETFKDANKYADAVRGKAQELKGRDSLARKVFGLKKMPGWISANQSSLVDGKYTVLSWIDDGAVKTERFNLVTDQSMIGHKVEIWYEDAYKSDREPGKAFAAVEQAEYITLLRDAMDSKDYKEAFGNKTMATGGLTLAVDGTGTTRTGTAADSVLNSEQGFSYIAGQQAPAGTYVIDNETNKICGYIAPAALTMAKVSYVDTTAENESISVGTLSLKNTAEEDEVNEYEGIAKDDYVTYTQVQEKYTLTKMESISGTITEYYTRKDDRHVVTINGEQYITGTAAGSISGMNKAAELHLPGRFSYDQEYVFFLAPDKSILGYETVEGGSFDMANTFFVLNVVSRYTENSYGVKSEEFFARGIDMTGNEAMIPVGAYVKDALVGADTIDDFSTNKITANPNDFYSVEDLTSSKEAKELGLKTLVPFSPKYVKDDPTTATHSVVADGVGNTTAEWSEAEGGQFAYGMHDKVSGGKTVNGDWLATYKGTKYIILDGTATQIDPLAVTVLTAEEADLYAAGAVNNRILRSRRATGGYELEVMVLMCEKDALAKNELIYVAAGKNDATGTDAKGNVFSVYDALTGAEKTITLKGITTIPTGFYSVGYDSEEGLHKIAVAAGDPVKVPGKLNQSEYRNSDNAKDGRKYENVSYDETLIGFNGSAITGSVTQYNSASGVKVIDSRTDDEVAKSGVARITSMDQLWGMVEAMEDRVRFELDMCWNGSKTVTAFVEVYNNSSYGGQGTNTVVYYDADNTEDTDEDGNANEVVVITSDMYPLYHVINVDASVLRDKGEGTYSFAFGADNKTTLETSGVPGTTVYAPALPSTTLDPLNTISKICTDFSDSDLIEYVYVAAEDLVVITDATTEDAPISGVTPIGTAASAVAFDKVYDPTGMLTGLTEDNFVTKAEAFEIDYTIYNTVTRKKLLVVNNAVELVKNAELEEGVSYEIIGELPAGMSLADVLDDRSYDVTYVLYAGEKVYVLECIKFTDYASDELEALDGNLRLTKDTALTAPIKVEVDTVLDLNGKELYVYDVFEDATPYFEISADATLTIKDSKGSGKINGKGRETAAPMINVLAGGTLKLEGGTLTGHKNTTATNSGVIDNAGTLLMTGGTISGNTGWNGGIVVLKQSVTTISGGMITENVAVRGGAIGSADVAHADKGDYPVVNISGGTFTKNEGSAYAGTMYFYSTKLNITGGDFTGNLHQGAPAANNGSRDCYIRGSIFTISGGNLGGVALGNDSEIAISGSANIYQLSAGGFPATIGKLTTGASVTVGTAGELEVLDGTVKVINKDYSYVGDGE